MKVDKGEHVNLVEIMFMHLVKELGEWINSQVKMLKGKYKVDAKACATLHLSQKFQSRNNSLKKLKKPQQGVGTHKGTNWITLQKDYESFFVLFIFSYERIIE